MPRDNKQDIVWRKKRTRISREPPLPVPVASFSKGLPSHQSWYCYTGYLQGSTVIVRHSGDVDFLYRMGFFGKGTLSRSEPNFECRRPKVNIQHSKSKSSESENGAGPSHSTIQVAVSSKRNYLKHMQYQALDEDDESGYNELVEQETMQRYKDGEEEDELEEEEEDEAEEESYDSDSSLPARFGSNSVYLPGGESRPSTELGSHSRTFLVSLLTQVAYLSKESIATFARVPQTLYQLEMKFQQMRHRQMAFSGCDDVDRLPASKTSKHFRQSGSQDMIDLRDTEEGDDIVVLNSDNSKDSEDFNRVKSPTKTKKKSMDWDDPNDKGDASFWGVKCSEGSNNLDGQDGGKAQVNLPGNAPEGASVEDTLSSPNCPESADDKGKDDTMPNKDATGPKRIGETDETESSKSDEKNMGHHDSSFGTSKEEGHESDTSNTQNAHSSKNSEGSTDDSAHGKQNEKTLEQGRKETNISSSAEQNVGSVIVNSVGGPSTSKADMPEYDSSVGQNNSKIASSSSNVDDDDSDDSDDVICVEDESAEPAKLHSFLSQPSVPKQHSQFPLISRMVRFMTNVSKEPKFVNAKVGFHSWTNILHFNFSGDETHLPTALEVLPDLESPHSHNTTLSSVVYERIYPPVNTLITNPNSKGVIIKQRLDEVPFLDQVKMQALRSLQHSHSDSSHVPLLHNNMPPPKQPHREMGSYSSPRKTFHPESSSLYQKAGGLLEEEEASSLNASHFSKYICIFHREKTDSGVNRHDSSKNDEGSSDVVVDECLITIHKELDRLKELLDTSNPSEDEEEDATDRDTQMLKFNCLVSEYLSKMGISLIKELVLLKILVCGSDIRCPIPKEDIVKAKVSLSSEENNFLLERLDFVQSCLSSHKSQHSTKNTMAERGSSDDVIMIDLSDEESNDKSESLDLNSTSPSKSQNKHKRNELNVGNSAKDVSTKASTSIGNSSTPANDGVAEGGENVSSVRKRSLQDTSSESEGDSKIAKLDSSLLEKSNGEENEGEKSATSNGSPGIQKSKNSLEEPSHNGHDSDETKEANQTVDSDSLSKDSESAGSTDVCKDSTSIKGKDSLPECASHDVSAATGESVLLIKSSNSSHHQNEETREINADMTDLGDANVKSSNESGTKRESVESRPENGDGSPSKDDHENLAKVTQAEVSLEEGQIYVESSDEEEERLFTKKTKKSKYFNAHFQPGVHPYSSRDNLAGDLFVIANTSDEDDEETNPSTDRFLWQPCVKKDPYPSKERLHLLLEEAFFLTFGLGCLTVLDPEKKPMSITDMWQQFPTLKDNFVPHYVAYHYFRSKGWVPKSGLKFGCDFVLYREGPPFYHGSYSVVVVAVREGTLTPMIGDDGGLDFPQRLNTWITLSGLNRVTEHVAKELMYCYVICPKHLTEEESKSPTCISQFRVKEVVVSRWVSSKERESKDKEEMP